MQFKIKHPPMMTPTEHEKREWARMARAAYGAGHNDVGHRFSAAAALRAGEAMPAARFNHLQDDYRNWLCYNQFPVSDHEAAEIATGVQ